MILQKFMKKLINLQFRKQKKMIQKKLKKIQKLKLILKNKPLNNKILMSKNQRIKILIINKNNNKLKKRKLLKKKLKII